MTNRHHRYLTLLLATVGIVVGLCPTRMMAGPQEQSGSVARMAGQDYALLFESKTNLSAQLQEEIAVDIALNLSHLRCVVFRSISQVREEPSQKYRSTITHWIDEGKEKRLFPEAMEKYFGGTIRSNDTYYVVVHEELAAQYAKALKFKDEHLNMFRQLEGFMSFINDPKEIDAAAQEPDVAKDMFFFAGISPQGYKYECELLGLKQMYIRSPSLLDFQSMTYEGKQIIFFATVIMSREGSGHDFIMKGFPLFAYVNDKWRIYVPRIP